MRKSGRLTVKNGEIMSDKAKRDNNSAEFKRWEQVKEYIATDQVTLGPYFSYQLRNTPRRILFSLSHYKFAAKLLGTGKHVLEVGCSEGLGTVLLAEFARKVTAIDIDAQAITEAQRNFASDKLEFRAVDILQAHLGEFDGIVCLDVIEHIYPENEAAFFTALRRQLSDYGLCIIGTPNLFGEQYASEVSRLGHVNVYTAERLRESMEKHFHQVFIFSANDEIIHTGFYPMAHYLLAVGVCKKEG
jgi:2-polyprenyl-3-methyl-5-hydroxy-6-metoxy-1,4-benzoquinol methylase